MKTKIPVGILGATGMVGQMFIKRLADHPWFEIVSLAASERSQGKTFKQASRWLMDSPIPEKVASMVLDPCIPTLPCQLVFSGLDSNVAGEIEESFAQAGYFVISNSKNHRMDPSVPLLVPEVNSKHLALLDGKEGKRGGIITNPNCSVVGLVMALKPLADLWGVEAVNVVTMQAISGAGYPGVSAYDIIDNVIPFISDEEDKVETEPHKILGTFKNNRIDPYAIPISAHCNRVACRDGHVECVSVKLKKKASFEEIVNAWNSYSAVPQHLKLPSAPQSPLRYFEEENYPQPKWHRNLGDGMTVSLGRLRKCPVLDWKFALLSHNLIRGAAGGAILNAELLVKEKRLKG